MVAPPEPTYDRAVWGGTTALEVDEHGSLLEQRVGLAGAVRTCAGGRTPRVTWLTCEETEGIAGQTKSHGWVFEVDPTGRRTKPVPIEPLGRHAHEAGCVDPHTNVAYLTEDAAGSFGLFYRFTPKSRLGGYHSYLVGGTWRRCTSPGYRTCRPSRRPARPSAKSAG